MRAHLVPAAAALLTGAGCGGCGGSEQPVWRSLAAGFQPAARPDRTVVWNAEPELALRPIGGSAAWWVTETLPAGAWMSSGNLWSAHASTPGAGRPPDGSPARSLGGRGWSTAFSYVAEPTLGELADPASVPAGSFTVLGDTVFVANPGSPPGELFLRTYVDGGKAVDGRWRVTLGRTTGDGIPVLPGRTEQLVLDLPPGSALRFATAASAFAGPWTETAAAAPLVFKVELDGAPIFEHSVQPAPDVPPEWHALALPPEGREDACLSFSVAGPPALAAFLSPTLGPRDAGSYGARPFAGGRPDLVLFLADTFRADNLELYGGTLGLTPVLDAFAGGALAFERAWSPASWTLPAQASMLSGLAPHQHSAGSRTERLPAELATIAERLRDAGYRTGAVTEGGFVSQAFGLDQGFEVFDERLARLEDGAGVLAAARAFLDADDGRPVFLFLQTYRTHVPYRVSEETRRAHGARFALERSFEEVSGALHALKQGWSQGAPVTAEMLAAVAAYRDLYRGAVIDLDHAFGVFLGELAERGLDKSAVLAFTSDHGESFFEHDTLGHGVSVHEEILRVPLLLRGPGVEPGRSQHAATLLDLPPTLARLAGASPAPAWGGRSLVDLDAERQVFAFECCMLEDKRSTLALVDGGRKVIAEDAAEALARGELLHAYELARDPREAEDVLPAGAAWPAELFARSRGALDKLLTPLSAGEEVQLGGTQDQELKKLGY